MKYKLILLSILSLLLATLSSCKEEKVKCKITSPENEAEFWESESIPVTVESSINKGSLLQVEIFVDDKVIESRTEPPYNFTLKAETVSPGLHYLTAVAYGSENQEVDNIFILIKKFICKITSPRDKAEFLASESIPVTVEASFNSLKDSIRQVQLFVDNKVIGSCAKPPYNFIIPANTIPAGMHYLTATAYSSNNQEADNIFIVVKE